MRLKSHDSGADLKVENAALRCSKGARSDLLTAPQRLNGHQYAVVILFRCGRKLPSRSQGRAMEAWRIRVPVTRGLVSNWFTGYRADAT